MTQFWSDRLLSAWIITQVTLESPEKYNGRVYYATTGRHPTHEGRIQQAPQTPIFHLKTNVICDLPQALFADMTRASQVLNIFQPFLTIRLSREYNHHNTPTYQFISTHLSQEYKN